MVRIKVTSGDPFVKEAKKKEKEKMPKKPRSSYLYYCEATRDDLKKEHPDLSMTELAKLLGEGWHSLVESEKAKYVAAAGTDKERYEREMEEGGFKKEPAEPKPKKPRKSKKEANLVGWQMPAGYAVQEAPPSAEQLAFDNAEGDALVGRHILFNWGGVGWCEGEVRERNTNKRLKIDGDHVNFYVYYAMDDNLSKHVLELEGYAWGPDADVDSWVLLSKLPDAAAVGAADDPGDTTAADTTAAAATAPDPVTDPGDPP